MQGKRITWRGMLLQRRITRDEFRSATQVQPRGGQRRHVQRLADVAGGVRPVGVLMENRAASSEIQQGRASQYGQAAPYEYRPQDGEFVFHEPNFECSITTGASRGEVPKENTLHPGFP